MCPGSEFDQRAIWRDGNIAIARDESLPQHRLFDVAQLVDSEWPGSGSSILKSKNRLDRLAVNLTLATLINTMWFGGSSFRTFQHTLCVIFFIDEPGTVEIVGHVKVEHAPCNIRAAHEASCRCVRPPRPLNTSTNSLADSLGSVPNLELPRLSSPEPVDSEVDVDVVLTLHGLVVKPTHRRRGLGAALVRTAEVEAARETAREDTREATREVAKAGIRGAVGEATRRAGEADDLLVTREPGAPEGREATSTDPPIVAHLYLSTVGAANVAFYRACGYEVGSSNALIAHLFFTDCAFRRVKIGLCSGRR